jgi:hypothetical protein
VPLLFLFSNFNTLIPLAAAIVATIAVSIVNIAIDKLLKVSDPGKLGVLAHLCWFSCALVLISSFFTRTIPFLVKNQSFFFCFEFCSFVFVFESLLFCVLF